LKVSRGPISASSSNAAAWALSPDPVKKAAGSITAHRPMNPTMATCQPALAIRPSAKGAATNVPIEPAAETVPRTIERLSGETARAVAARARLSAVHDNARPTITPSPITRPSGPVANTVTASPAA